MNDNSSFKYDSRRSNNTNMPFRHNQIVNVNEFIQSQHISNLDQIQELSTTSEAPNEIGKPRTLEMNSTHLLTLMPNSAETVAMNSNLISINNSIGISNPNTNRQDTQHDFNPIDQSEFMQNNQKPKEGLRLSNIGVEIKDPIDY